MQIEAIYFRGVRTIPVSEYRPEPLTVMDGILPDAKPLAFSFTSELEPFVNSLEPMTLCAVISEISETTYNGLNQKNRAIYIETDGGNVAGEEIPKGYDPLIEIVLTAFKARIERAKLADWSGLAVSMA